MKRMAKFSLLFNWICICLFLSSCSQGDIYLDTEEVTSEAFETETNSTNTLTNDSFSTLRSPMPCLEPVGSSITNTESVLTGTLGILLVPSIDNAQVMLEVQNQQKDILTPVEGIRNIGFSPNGHWFAYQKLDIEKGLLPESAIHLHSFDGNNLTTAIPLEEGETSGGWFSTWINDNNMLLMYDVSSDDTDVSKWAFTVFNPFTGEKQKLLENLPYWNQETSVYLSPDMTRIVYAGRNEEGSVLVLWDVNHQKELWSKPFVSDLRFDENGMGAMSGFGKIATWDPDNRGFIFSTTENTMDENNVRYRTYFVERDGNQEKILIDTLEREDNIIYDGSWSPNGRYVVSINRWKSSIFLYDFSLGQLIELCSGLPPYVNDLLWSPDSNYLAFLSEIDGKPHLLVLDIYTGEVTKINQVQNFIPAGWFYQDIREK